MIILSKEDNEKLKKINEKYKHLNRALEAVALKDGSFCLSKDVLLDDATWGHWLALLSELPQRDVAVDEFDLPEDPHV